MARSGRRGSSDLGGTLTGLLRSTLAQAGVVREALERGARTGRARLDEALGDAAVERRRVGLLAELGDIIFALVRDGEIDLDELPEIRSVIERLERLEAEERGATSRGVRRSARAGRVVDDPGDRRGALHGDAPPWGDDPDDDGDEETVVGSRRKTIPLPRRDELHRASARPTARMASDTERQPRGGSAADDLDEPDEPQDAEQLGYSVTATPHGESRRSAATQPMRATRPLPLHRRGAATRELSPDGGEGEYENELDDEDEGDEHDERGGLAGLHGRFAAARGATDGTVSSANWRPPAAAEQRVWRPDQAQPFVPKHRRGDPTDGQPLHRASGESGGAGVERAPSHEQPTARLRPMPAAPASAAPAMEAELSTVEDEPVTPPAAPGAPGDALAAVTARSPFGAGRGGISFDDDLEEYMHPDDVPPRERS